MTEGLVAFVTDTRRCQTRVFVGAELVVIEVCGVVCNLDLAYQLV